jgi:hypothetical protein
MFKLKVLNDSELNEKIKSLAAQERSLTQVILEHIAEVDRRKLFLAMSYPSLFDYLTREIGYSAGAAQRRIDAARLLQKIPEVSFQIKDGLINLAQISKMQKLCRHIKKETGVAVDVSIQKSVLEKLENQGALQTDLILAQEFKIEIKTEEKKQIQRDESTRVELTFSREEMGVIQKAQALLSHQTGGNLKCTFMEMAKQVIRASSIRMRKQGLQSFSTGKIPSSVAITPVSIPTATVAVKTITPKLRREILARDQVCQFTNIKTGKMCGSGFFLEIDHIKPKFAGGGNASENLRVLCKKHNIYRYEAGI